MPRSMTIWAAALVLASFSGSGSLVTTAEALPAPGPEPTQGRPRYYFPRQVKRQIVTNTTAPALPTPAARSSSSQLESRQFGDFLDSIVRGRPASSSKVVVTPSEADGERATPTPIVVLDPPARSARASGTGNVQRPRPVASSSAAPEEEEPQSPAATPGPKPSPTPEVETPVRQSERPARSSPPAQQEAPSSAPVPSSIVRPTPSPSPESPEPTPTPERSPEPSSPPASSFVGPFIIPGPTGSVPQSVLQSSAPEASPSPSPSPSPTPEPASSGPVPSSIVLPTSSEGEPSPSANRPLIVLPSSGIVVGITTFLGTGNSEPTPTPSAPVLSSIPASESVPESVSVQPSAAPLPSSQFPVISSLLSSVAELPTPIVSGAGPIASETPSGSVVVPISVDPASSPLPSGIISSFVPTSVAEASPSVAPSVIPSQVPASESPAPSPSSPVVSPTVSVAPSETPGVTPLVSAPPSGSVASPAPSASPSEGPVGIPASESAALPSPAITSTPLVQPPTAANATESASPIASETPGSVAFTPTPTSTRPEQGVQSQRPIGSDSATVMPVGTSIVQEASPTASIIATASGIPSSLPKFIAPPGGVPTDIPADSFMGQVCFKWPLNYNFVATNDAPHKQIFYYLPMAISDGLGISLDDVRNFGLKGLDTTRDQGFVTTLAMFTIPKDLSTKLVSQLHNPIDDFWRNKNQTVNDLTALINTACPLPAGKLPGDNGSPNQPATPGSTGSGGAGNGGAMGGDINSNRPVNASAAGIATGAIVGAIAYGAAMFFVARRYRNKRIAHQRASSVSSVRSGGSYGSIPGGAAAWMHGARNGRFSPSSRGSLGSSDSSNGRSVRTQQISAPVMAENSLGWN